LAPGSGKTGLRRRFLNFFLPKSEFGGSLAQSPVIPAKAARPMAGKEREREFIRFNRRNPLKRLDPAKPIQANPNVFL
jgi:hypothetical protein